MNRHHGTVSDQFSDPKWKAPENGQLSFQYYCTQPQTVIFVVNRHFQAEIEIGASDDWQTMIVRADQVRHPQHPDRSIGDWSGVGKIQIKPKPGSDITKVIFARFEWVLP